MADNNHVLQLTAAQLDETLRKVPELEETVGRLSEEIAAGTAGQFATSDGAGGIKWITMPTYNGEVEDA